MYSLFDCVTMNLNKIFFNCCKPKWNSVVTYFTFELAITKHHRTLAKTLPVSNRREHDETIEKHSTSTRGTYCRLVRGRRRIRTAVCRAEPSDITVGSYVCLA